MSLTTITKTTGRIQDEPKRIIGIGLEGIGKSTFGADAPSPVFLCPEDGIKHLPHIPKFPEPETWQDVLDAIDNLARGDHEHRTLVVDTLDWIEPFNHAEVCRKGNKAGIEDFGYGKGYVAALDEWRVFLSRLEKLRRAKRMDVILLAHSWIRPYKNPIGDDYDRFEMKIHNKAAGLLKEWADAVLFMMYDEATRETESGRVKGVSSGARIIRTTRHAAWDAKNRYSLPERLPLSWDAFIQSVERGTPKSADAYRKSISDALEKITDAELAGKVLAATKDAGDDTRKLAQYLNRLEAIVAETPTPTPTK